jgi:hypothetical protein
MVTLEHFAKRIHIDISKLTRYALDPNSDKGKHKARVFKAMLGYTQANYQSLLDQIQTQALTAEARLKRTDQYGQHIQVDLKVVGPTGKKAVVRTGWLIETNSDIARLITLYVKEKIE